MKEARLIFPVSNYDSPSNVAWRRAKDAINSAFGGSTTFWATGYWKTEQEFVQVCEIAYEQNTANDMQLFNIAVKFRQEAKQAEVYLRYGNGHVQMVNEHSIMDNGRPNCWYSPDFAGVVDAINSLADPEQTPGTRIAAFEFLFKTMRDGGKGNHDYRQDSTLTLTPRLGGALRGEEWGASIPVTKHE